MTAHMPISNCPQPVKFSAREFWLLADAGVFREFVRTELIEGEICVVNSIWSRHARAHATLTFELGLAIRSLHSPLVLLTAPSTELSDDSIPEPDIAIARNADGKALQGADVQLAVEISDTTLDFDLGRKLRMYARHGVPEYWVADVAGKVIHQHWEPQDESFAQTRTVSFGEPITAATISELIVETKALLT
jgi:Uma2 family endonuclease